MEWEAGRYLGKKVGAEEEEDTSESARQSGGAGIRAPGQKDRRPDR